MAEETIIRAEDLDYYQEKIIIKPRTRRIQNVSENSKEGYLAIKETIGERQRIVLQAFEEICQVQPDATDREVTQYLYQQKKIPFEDADYIRPRRFELEEAGLLKFSNKRRCTISGIDVDARRPNK